MRLNAMTRTPDQSRPAPDETAKSGTPASDIELVDDDATLKFHVAARARERERLRRLPIVALALELAQMMERYQEQKAIVHNCLSAIDGFGKGAAFLTSIDLDASGNHAKVEEARAALTRAREVSDELEILLEEMSRVYRERQREIPRA